MSSSWWCLSKLLRLFANFLWIMTVFVCQMVKFIICLLWTGYHRVKEINVVTKPKKNLEENESYYITQNANPKINKILYSANISDTPVIVCDCKKKNIKKALEPVREIVVGHLQSSHWSDGLSEIAYSDEGLPSGRGNHTLRF